MTITLHVKGMTCNHCKAAVTNALQELGGVTKAEVHLREGKVDIDFDETKVNIDKVKEAIEDQGYDVK
ncbi:copper chaperone CopZ [Bacillus sp. 165]|uniref:copper chaperone CopZ n=1 Tax=Bacillus sp. 165 TaxID=1529117 RepID=UPI001ADB48AC|nr:copper chaperone CopZ [Bacillus sp. 165]MBO9130829.1 copper chaperone CopZ [Bacillus sp. 165]